MTTASASTRKRAAGRKAAVSSAVTKGSKSVLGFAKSLSPTNMFLGGVGLLAGYFAIKEFSDMFSKKQQDVIDDNLDDAINHEENQGNKLSYPLTQYDIWAGVIEEATNTSGTDEDAIYSVFNQLNNNTDLLQLVKAYGKRLNFWFGVPTGNLTLPQVLVAELDSSELKEINNILYAKGITISIQ